MPAAQRTAPEEGRRARAGARQSGLARKQVSDIQRARMLAAMADVAAERGALDASVSHVVARSGVSRRTFYEIFEGREDCFLAAFDDAVERAGETAVAAYRSERSWRSRMRAGLSALLDFCEREPVLGRLLFVDSLGGGPPVQARRRAVVVQLIALVDEGRSETAPRDSPPQLSAEGVVGAVLAVIHARLLEKRSPGDLIEIVNPLMNMIVLPYLGRAAANKELEQAVQHSMPARSTGGGNHLLRDLGMRLTYRTVRVLGALEQWPKGSNRRIAESSGISDQGQISRLLARLEGLGLVENVGMDTDRGAPNAWLLTEKGRELQGIIRQQLVEA